MSHKAQGILCSASCDPDLQLFHQVHAHAVEITQKPEWEKGNSFLMRHPSWKMESIYLAGTKCAWWKAEAHTFLFHKKICHINGEKKLKPSVAAAPSRGLDCPCQYGSCLIPQQLHGWARLSSCRNERRSLVIHKHLSGFPVKTSELTVGSALRWRRCDAFYIDLRFPFQGRADGRWCRGQR